MRKKILFTIAPIFLIFTIFVSYLSIYGIKTDSFNYFINKKIKEYNSKLILKIDLLLYDATYKNPLCTCMA